MPSKKDYRQLMKRLVEQGFEIRRTSKNYPMVWKDGRFVTKMAQTPGDGRSYKNALASLKRAGYEKGD